MDLVENLGPSVGLQNCGDYKGLIIFDHDSSGCVSFLTVSELCFLVSFH